jgi:hypothetical protein
MVRILKADLDGRMSAVVSSYDANTNPLYFGPDFDFAKLDRQKLPGWIEHLRKAEANTRILRRRLEDELSEASPTCGACGVRLTGRRDRRYCSASCRQRNHRSRIET